MAANIPGQSLLDGFQEFIRIVKQRKHEKVLASLASIFLITDGWAFTGAKGLPSIFEPYVPHLKVGLSLLLFITMAWLAITVWKQLHPQESEPKPLKPDAIKGPRSFGPLDGEIFVRLGREKELQKLLGLVLDDRIPLVVVVGEIGAGKTSLLRSGLAYLLEHLDKPIEFVYWEALPSDPVAGLLNTVNSVAVKPSEKLTDLVSHNQGPRRVIVIDQFEQLRANDPRHKPIFDMLELASHQTPPHRTTFVVAFRREFEPEWWDFAADRLEAPAERLPLRLLHEDQAREAMAVLAESAGLILDTGLVNDWLKAVGKGEDGGPGISVSPVDIGIGMLVLCELAGRKGVNHLSLDDYRFARGSEGLIAGYFEQQLNRLAPDRDGVLKALLSLVDLNKNQRLAEGRSLEELAESSGINPKRLEKHLHSLEQAFLLERLPSKAGSVKRYRLPHERLISALRWFKGADLSEIEQANLALETGFNNWCQSREGKCLLSGPKLRLVNQFRDDILRNKIGEPEEKYLRMSLRRRSWKRVLAAVSILGVFGLVGLGNSVYQQMVFRRDLREWTLPDDLYSRQHQLKRLTIHADVTNLAWLTAPLVQLEIFSNNLKRFDRLPATLKELSIDAPFTELGGLENLKNLTSLKLIGNIETTSLAGIEKLTNLTSLNMFGNLKLESLAGIEKLTNLTSLNLSDDNLAWDRGGPVFLFWNRSDTRFAGIEKLTNLTSLNLSNYDLTGLAGIEKLTNLTSLNIFGDRGLTSLARIEKLTNLTSLDLIGSDSLKSLAGIEKLTNLTSLNLSGSDMLEGLAGIEKLTNLTSLNLRWNRGLTSLAGIEKLPNLTSLNLSDDNPAWYRGGSVRALLAWNRIVLTSLAGIEKLTNLTSLNLSNYDLKSLAGIEKLTNLTSLNISSNEGLTSLAGIEKITNLTSLDLSGCRGLTSLAGIEKLTNLTSLNLRSSLGLKNLVWIEKLTNLTSLNLSYYDLTSLAGIEKLTNLTSLDLSGCRGLTSLAGIEKLTNLTSLDLSGCRGLTSLAGIEKLTNLMTLDLTESAIVSLKGMPPSVTDLRL